MSIFTAFKAKNAAKKYQAGDVEGALKIYEECYNEGLREPRQLLNYAIILIRSGKYAQAREMLVKIQKLPMAEPMKRELFTDYATCAYKMGEIEKGIELLERQHQKQPSGLVYETLGYLYVEHGDAEKALAFNQEALEYDDEDPITLDNLAQTYYRLLNDKEKAHEYFKKALVLKPGQIDTLYFLAQYDIEAGNRQAAREKIEKALTGRFSPLNYATRDMLENLLAIIA